MVRDFTNVPPRSECAARAVWMPSNVRYGWWLRRADAVRGYGVPQLLTPFIVIAVLAGLMVVSFVAMAENAIFGFVGFALLFVNLLLILLIPHGQPLPFGVDVEGATAIAPWRWMPPVDAHGIIRCSLHRVRRSAVLAIWINNMRPLITISLTTNGRGVLDRVQIEALIGLIDVSPVDVLEAREIHQMKHVAGPPLAATDAVALLRDQCDWTTAGAAAPSPADAFLDHAFAPRPWPKQPPQ